MRRIVLLFVWISARALASDRDTLPGLKESDAIKNPSTIVWRCGASKRLGHQPLYVVDGVAYDSVDIGKINPNNILSIEILKASAATVLYGYRAMYGAIVITTKRTKKLVIQDADTKSLLQGATVRVLPGKNLKQALVHIADKKGEVDISPLEKEEYSIEISCVGYKSRTIKVSPAELNYLVQMEKEYKKLDTLVLVASAGGRGCRLRCGSEIRVTAAARPEPSERPLSFSIYPNPAGSPGSVTINLLQAFEGSAEIINASGQIIQRVNLSDNYTKPVIHLNAIPAGFYFIRVSQSKSGRILTQKLTVH